jgi:hypothetical protein
MMFWMAYGSASEGLSATGSSRMGRPAGVHDASERRFQGVLFTGLLLSLPYPEPKRHFCAILVRLSPAMDFFSGV